MQCSEGKADRNPPEPPGTRDPSRPRLALVVFVGHAESRWLRGLRAGFRHCFVVVREETAWLVCEPLKDRFELTLLPVPARFDLQRFYAMRGHTVLLGPTRPDLPRRGLAPVPLTCVTIAKRLLGVRAPWVMTPWQLYRHLKGTGYHFLELQQLPEARLQLDMTLK
jgi:hypothetical protein